MLTLKTAPCLLVVLGTLVAPTAAVARTHPAPVANSHYHPMPVPNSARTHTT